MTVVVCDLCGSKDHLERMPEYFDYDICAACRERLKRVKAVTRKDSQ